MITELNIREHNKDAYISLIKDMVAHGTGIFQANIRISAGEIVDYVIYESLPPTAFTDEPGSAQIPCQDRVVGAEVTIRHATVQRVSG